MFVGIVQFGVLPGRHELVVWCNPVCVFKVWLRTAGGSTLSAIEVGNQCSRFWLVGAGVTNVKGALEVGKGGVCAG